MNILALYEIGKLSCTYAVRYFIEFIAASLYPLTPFAAVIFPQAEADYLKLGPVVKPEYGGHQMRQRMIREIIAHVPHPYLEQWGHHSTILAPEEMHF